MDDREKCWRHAAYTGPDRVTCSTCRAELEAEQIASGRESFVECLVWLAQDILAQREREGRA